MEVKELHLILENCEYVVIPTKHLASLNIDEISHSISRTAINSVSKDLKAKSVYLEILKPEELEVFGFGEVSDDYTCKSRIENGGDITAVQVHYKDGTFEYYYVEWDHNDFYNSYQKLEYSHNGNLHLLIHKDKSLKDYLDGFEEGNYDFRMNEEKNFDFGFWE